MAITVIAVMATGLLGGSPEPVERAAPPPSPSATPTRTPTPTPRPPPPEGPVASAVPTRVEVPAVGLVVDVLPVTPDGGELDPPTLDEAYWIEPYGTPASDADNTVYLVGHSYDSGDAAFNPLFDRTQQVATVAAGDKVVVTTGAGRLTYVVDSTQRHPKDELADVDEVWRIAPGRLVLITCFQRNDGGASQDNLVVYATLVSSTPV